MTEAGARNRRSQGTPEAPLVAIVDDDASVRASTRRLISSFGYRAAAFASGEELLASAAVADAACIILDVRMPHMDGLEVQRQLGLRGRRTPIVFISAHASDDDERRARTAGAIEFLRKPIATTVLRLVLSEVFSKGDER